VIQRDDFDLRVHNLQNCLADRRSSFLPRREGSAAPIKLSVTWPCQRLHGTHLRPLYWIGKWEPRLCSSRSPTTS
jgi:hypothetical protein